MDEIEENIGEKCIFQSFWRYWGLNSGLRTCKAGTSITSATPLLHFAVVILEMGWSHKLFARAGLSNQDPPDLSLWSS
jgi:hypothetical protein